MQDKGLDSMLSIIQDRKECYVCKSPFVEEHHIFFGSLRKKSEKHGLKVWLCPTHHRDNKHGVHGNRELDIRLKCIGQMAFEEIHRHELYMKEFRRNYL